MALERFQSKITLARKKWMIMKSIIEVEQIDDLRYTALERCIEIISQTIIDVSVWISRFFNEELPLTNRDVILNLKQIPNLSNEFVERLALIAGLRNLLVQEYGKIEYDLIISSAENLVDDFPIFIDGVMEFLKDNQITD